MAKDKGNNGMLTAMEVREAFGALKTYEKNGILHRAAQAETDGRLARDSSPQLRAVGAHQSATFSSEAIEAGGLVSDWILFGDVAFVSEPFFTCGPVWLNQPGEPSSGADGATFVWASHAIYPAVAMQFAYGRDDKGMYRRAKVLCLAWGDPPEGYVAQLDLAWIGLSIAVG